jgi:uncharacterized membrane protein YphA (DoxX/SURF4 family)
MLKPRNPANSSASRPPRVAFSFSAFQLFSVSLRWVLAGFFIYLGVTKLRHAGEFLTFVQTQLHVSDPTLASVFAGSAPWLEIAYGLLLVSGRAPQTAALIARWWLAVVFIFMGLNKAVPDPQYFLKLVRQYHMVDTHWLLNSIAAALPWFEVFCGLLLLFGVAVRGTALMLIVMLLVFSPIVVKRALEIAADGHLAFCAVKFDCGCGMGELFICHKLVENTVLLLLSAWLLLGSGTRLCLLFSVLRDKARPAKQPEPALAA